MAVDPAGNVYAGSEDGNLYVIGHGGRTAVRTFLKLALGAAYTPVTVGGPGLIYAQNAGHLYVLGNR